MRKVAVLIAVAVAMTSAANAKKQEEAIDPGPPPSSIEDFQRLAVPALLNGFFDPSSAQISWDRGITGGYWKPPLSKKIPGWFTCGLVNAKNRMGGYVGLRRFVVVQNHGQVVYASTGDGSNFDFVQIGCDKAIKDGVLPPASAATTSIPSIQAPPVTHGIGVVMQPVPDGAYIAQVSPNGPAARGGITPGMVISHINGVSIRGFDIAIVVRIIQGAEGPLNLR